MRKLPKRALLATGMLALTSNTAAVAGVEKVVELTEVPAEIMAVAETHLADLKLAIAAPGPVDDGSVIDDNLVIPYEDLGKVEIVSANTETEEDDSFVYEIQGMAEGGRKIEIDIDPDGRVLEIEVEFRMEDVPGAVLSSLEAQRPDFVPNFIEASHSASMQVIGYEFVGTEGDEAIDIEVSADGRTIVVADQ